MSKDGLAGMLNVPPEETSWLKSSLGDLGVGVSCGASRRDCVGIGVRIRSSQRTTTGDACEAEYSLHHGRRHRLDAAKHLSPRPRRR